jgi:hypothetical protein
MVLNHKSSNRPNFRRQDYHPTLCACVFRNEKAMESGSKRWCRCCRSDAVAMKEKASSETSQKITSRLWCGCIVVALVSGPRNAFSTTAGPPVKPLFLQANAWHTLHMTLVGKHHHYSFWRVTRSTIIWCRSSKPKT